MLPAFFAFLFPSDPNQANFASRYARTRAGCRGKDHAPAPQFGLAKTWPGEAAARWMRSGGMPPA